MILFQTFLWVNLFNSKTHVTAQDIPRLYELQTAHTSTRKADCNQATNREIKTKKGTKA